jgi:hypothetical protein
VVASGNMHVSPRLLPDGARFLPKPYDMDHAVDVIRTVARRGARGRDGGTGSRYESNRRGDSGSSLSSQ